MLYRVNLFPSSKRLLSCVDGTRDCRPRNPAFLYASYGTTTRGGHEHESAAHGPLFLYFQHVIARSKATKQSMNTFTLSYNYLLKHVPLYKRLLSYADSTRACSPGPAFSYNYQLKYVPLNKR